MGGCGCLETTDFLTVSSVGGCHGSDKKWFLTLSTLAGCGCLERTDLQQFLLLEGVVVLKELMFNSFYFKRVLLSWNNWFSTVSTVGGCHGSERTHF